MSVAVVLAGGGVTGIAWETGVLLGLERAGHDCVGRADLIVGTSAGSTVGAQVLSHLTLEDLYRQQTADDHGEITPEINVELLARILGELALGGTSSDDRRREIGTLALGARTVTPEERRRVIEWRLPTHDWPSRPLVLTAIHARSGEFVTWDKTSGVSLVDAVASSCAVPGVWPCVTIDGRQYYDGGLRTSTNAHLAAGHDRVVIIAPLAQGITSLIQQEIDDLQAQGATVSFITTDDEAKAAMGVNALDPTFRRVSAEQGLRQGLAARITL